MKENIPKTENKKNADGLYSPKFPMPISNSKQETSEKKENLIVNEINLNPSFTLNDLELDGQSSSNHEIIQDKSYKLSLTGKLFFNKTIIINEKGMTNCSLRKKNDSTSFFGVSRAKDYTGTYYNDFVINFTIDEEHNTQSGRVFSINYSKKTNEFKINLINTYVIIYYIIENYLYFELEKEYYLFLGKTFFIINIKKINSKRFIGIHVEVNSQTIFDKIYGEDINPISIGRDPSNTVVINNPSISKKHAEISYSKEIQQFKFRDLGSTNQSIMVIKEDDALKLKGEMKFRLEDVPFKILELP